ncbi:MAG: hypothetical protein RJA22_910 [Verrucomicrobiota bacterium]|jgi:hypothetical protein
MPDQLTGMECGSGAAALKAAALLPHSKTQSFASVALLALAVLLLHLPAAGAASLERIPHRHPGLVTDLAVGLWAWPLPMDWDDDGDLDLLVACPDKPSNGVYLFENPAGRGVTMPVFKAGRRLGPGAPDMTLSWVNGQPRLMAGRNELPNFRAGDFTTRKAWWPQATVVPIRHARDHFWRWADFDGDGRTDLVVGHGDWSEFGWFDRNEWWRHYDRDGVYRAPLPSARILWLRNEGSEAEPKLATPQPILAGGRPASVEGRPGQMLGDFDGDGDLDLLCGEFLDGFTYFQNTGSRRDPRYAAGRRLARAGVPVTVELEMPVPHAIDWDADGDLDLIVGDEDGRVAFLEHTGTVTDGLPQFAGPRYFQQEADTLKFGALVTPCGTDWDGDGDIDFIAGNTAGYIGFIENLGGRGEARPKFAAPRRLAAGGEVIRIQAGSNGSVQGPIEGKWGYTTQTVADWDGDGLPDILANSIWGRVVWYRNLGPRARPQLAAAQPVEVAWTGPTPKPAWNWWNAQGRELVTQWRTTPAAVDWNQDNLTDLVMLDHEGYLAFWERAQGPDGRRLLRPPQRVLCDEAGQPLRLNPGVGGKSGRRKLCVVDWDGDGQLDLLLNSKNADFYRQVGRRDGRWLFRNEGALAADNIEAHDVSPTTVDWDDNGIPDFVGGGEDGRFYFLRNPRAARP